MKSATLIGIFAMLTAVGSYENHFVFTSLLSQHVVAGRVNYKKLCRDERLQQYLEQLKSTNPASLPNDQDRLAFWINAYNSYTIQAICEKYPVKSINELHSGGLILGTVLHTTIWDKDFVLINNQKTTLNHIEHKIIRPVFKDPRAHFALVCASKSCPPLRSEAYEGSRLNQQLQDQARIFLTDPSRNRFDPAQKKAYLSKIFDWYQKDFGKNEKEVLLYLAQFLPKELAATIRSKPEEWKVQYLPYDWSLNE